MGKDEEPPKLVPLTGGGNPNLTAETIRKMKHDLPHIQEFLKILAQQKWTYYSELKKQGFTEQEALSLTIAAPI